MEIPKTYMVRVIGQFLLENQISLDDVSATLVAEQHNSSIGSNDNKLDSKEIGDLVRSEQWDLVLTKLVPVLDDVVLAFDVFEHLVKVLAAHGSAEAASTLVNTAPILASVLKRNDPARYAHLVRVAEGKTEAFSSITSDEEERARLGLALRIEDFTQRYNQRMEGRHAGPSLESGRLLNFVQDAIKWRRLTNGPYRRHEWEVNNEEVDESTSKRQRLEGIADYSQGAEAITWSKPRAVASKFGKGVSLQCGAVSFDGASFAVGTSDGFIEIFGMPSMKLRKDLPYQANEEPLLVEGLSVSSLCFSLSSELLACGDTSGKVQVFRVSNGATVRKIDTGHSRGGVASLGFSLDEAKLATGGVDGVCRVFSVSTGARLCECIGHESFINSIAFLSSTRLVSGSSDEKICFWNSMNGDLVKAVKVPGGGKVIRLIPLKQPAEITGPACFALFGEFTHLLLGTPSRVSLLSLETYAVTTLITAPAGSDILDIAVSKSGHSVYALTQTGTTKDKVSTSVILTLDQRNGSKVHNNAIPALVPSGSKQVDFRSVAGIYGSSSDEHVVVALSRSAIASFTS